MGRANNNPKELIKRISCACDVKVQKFFENVLVIEAINDGEIEVACRGIAEWSVPNQVSKSNKKTYSLEMDKALATGLKKITGGNPLAVVGNWGMLTWFITVISKILNRRN